MYTVHGSPRRAQAAALATPCCPAPVSATMRLRAEAPGEQRLPDGVVDLVGAGVRQVLALQPDLRPPARREPLGERERRRTADPAVELPAELALEFPRVQVLAHAARQALERRDESLGHIASAEGTEAPVRVRVLAGDQLGEQPAGIGRGNHCIHRVSSVSLGCGAAAARAARTNFAIVRGTLQSRPLFHAARDIDTEGPHGGDGRGHVVGAEAAGEYELRARRQCGGRAPVAGHAGAAVWPLEQQARRQARGVPRRHRAPPAAVRASPAAAAPQGRQDRSAARRARTPAGSHPRAAAWDDASRPRSVRVRGPRWASSRARSRRQLTHRGANTKPIASTCSSSAAATAAALVRPQILIHI